MPAVGERVFHTGVCYTDEMQSQAAPDRFHGPHPHCLIIPDKYIPNDKFVRKEIKRGLLNYKKDLLEENIIRHLQDTQYLLDHYEKEAVDTFSYLKEIKDKNATLIEGHFPHLVLDIKDEEIKQVIKEQCQGDFDRLDLKDIKCTCADKPSYEEVFDASTSNRVGERDAILYKDCKRCILAAAKRQMKAAPKPTQVIAEDFIQYAKQKIDQYIGTDLINFEYSFGQWYNHLSAPKQQQMRQVIADIQMHDEAITLDALLNGEIPLNRVLKASDKLIQKLYHYEAICKAEIQGPDGKPRMVCKIPLLVKFIMGPITWKLEDIAAKKIPCYCGGMNLQQMATKINHYIDLGFTQVAQGDGSAFDNSQDISLKAIDRYIYNKIPDSSIHHVHPELFRIASNQYYKIMDVLYRDPVTKKIQNLLSYAILGTVFSGDCDTTLMNTLRMGLYNMYTNEKAGLEFGKDFICFSKGDDFTVMYKWYITFNEVQNIYDGLWLKKPSKNAPNQADCRVYGIGQILKFIDLGPPNIFEFCSLKAFYIDDNQHIYLTRNPEKLTALGRYSRKIKNMDDYQAANYMLDLRDALLVSYGQLDYFKKVAKCYELKAQWYHWRGQNYSKPSIRIRNRLRLTKEKEHWYLDHPNALRDDEDLKYSDYWESVKFIYQINPTVLRPDEIRIVNQQLEEMNLPDPYDMLMPQ